MTLAKTAVITFCVDPDIGKRIRAVMRRYGASLQDSKQYSDHFQQQFMLADDCDVDMLNRALDSEVGAHNFKGRVSG